MKKLISTFSFFLFFLLGWNGSAFADHSDLLYYDGETYLMTTNPLGHRPDIDSLAEKMFGKHSHGNHICAKHYYAKWEIIDSMLYLVSIHDADNELKTLDLTWIYKDEVVDGKVLAKWYTDIITTTSGKKLAYWGGGYQYSLITDFDFRRGKLRSVTVFDDSISKQSVYSRDSLNLMKYIYSNIQWEKLPPISNEEDDIVVVVNFSADEDGKIDQVRVNLANTDVKIFKDEALRVVGSIPEWDVYYIRENFHRKSYNMPVIFSNANKKAYWKPKK